MGLFTKPSENVRKRVPDNAVGELDRLKTQAYKAFSGYSPTRREYMLGLTLAFWVINECDNGRIRLSNWNHRYLYNHAKNCGKALSDNERREAEQFLMSVIE